jgi:hypothetical protein
MVSYKIVGQQNGTLKVLTVLEIIAGFVVSRGVGVATLSGWIILLLRLPIPYPGNLVYFLFGIAMIFGGLNGYSKMKTGTK